MELYLDLLSPPCRAVFLFAKTLKIPFDFKHVELAEGQQYSEEFAKLSIVKKVPVLKDGDFVLTESTAILKYLARKCLVADHWFPADLRQQALVNEYSSWQHLNLRSHCSKVFLFKTLFPAIMGSEVSKEKMDIALEDLRHSLDLLEEKFLKDKLFLVSNKISLADVVAVVEVMQSQYNPKSKAEKRKLHSSQPTVLWKHSVIHLFDYSFCSGLGCAGRTAKAECLERSGEKGAWREAVSRSS
uniref:Glutathione S-transferase theta 1a n=1 Tax=Oryzias melastigma TaxID=30732 RepID=A0A3B3BT31_ORYME